MNFEAPTTSALGTLTLLALRGVGPQAVARLASRFATLDEVRNAPPSALEAVPSQARASLRTAAAWETAFATAEQTLEDSHRHQAAVLTASDPQYPEWLRAIPDRPPILYLKGQLRPGRRYVACIGTREPSRFGEEVTRRIGAFLGERDWSIVSGLALGVDTLAHRAALEVQAHTVAVLANGLDAVYPKKNSVLASEILERGGALVSEQPFGSPAIPRNLVQRDRLQSGMSAGTIVMQTDVKGGSMHTVRFTLLQRRLLFAPLPSGAHAAEPKSQGTLALAQVPGRELAQMLGAAGEYASLLTQTFAQCPVATPIASRDDYAAVLSELDRAAASYAASADSDRQVGLF